MYASSRHSGFSYFCGAACGEATHRRDDAHMNEYKESVANH